MVVTAFVMVSPAGVVRIMYIPSSSPKAAWLVHVVGSSQSASSARPQPCPRRAYIPLRTGGVHANQLTAADLRRAIRPSDLTPLRSSDERSRRRGRSTRAGDDEEGRPTLRPQSRIDRGSQTRPKGRTIPDETVVDLRAQTQARSTDSFHELG